MSYSYLSSEPYDFTSHVTANVTGHRAKFPVFMRVVTVLRVKHPLEGYPTSSALRLTPFHHQSFAGGHSINKNPLQLIRL
jgi:hypothetical protein